MSATVGIEASTKDQHEEIEYQVVHEIKGRIRIRVPQLAVDPAYAVRLQQLVQSLNFVTSVRINPLASSIIVQYRASAISTAIQAHLLSCIQQAGIVEEDKKFTHEQPTLKLENDGVIPANSNNSHASLDETTPGKKLGGQPESLPLTASVEAITAAPTVEESLNLPDLTFNKAVSSPAVTEKQTSEETLPLAASTEATISSVKLHLNQNDLAKRLGIPTQALTHQRTKPKFSEWSKARDPEGKAWIYASGTRSYHTDERKARKAKQSDAAHSGKNGKVGREDISLAVEEPLLAETLPSVAETTPVAAMEEPASLPEILSSDTSAAASSDTVAEQQVILDTDLSNAFPQETTAAVETEKSSVKLNLSQNDLAKRLGVTNQALTHQRTKPKFNEWSKARDPEGRVWIYASATKSYHTDERTHIRISDAAHSEKNGQFREKEGELTETLLHHK